MPLYYEVTITLANADTARAWLDWMHADHVPAVLQAGAASARLIRLDDPPHTFVAQYDFISRDAFDRYVAIEQPRLRDDSLRHFPPPHAAYARRIGIII